MSEQPSDPHSFASGASPIGASSPGAQPSAASSGVDFTPAGGGRSQSDRPEAVIAGTFVGGLVLATILKRLAR